MVSTTSNPTVAASAPGKVLFTGGYLVLDRRYTGLVFGLSARINVISGEIHTGPGVQLNEIVVDSPQFLDARWRYGYHLAPEDGGIKVTQLQVGSDINPNSFVETTLSYALTYVNHHIGTRGSSASIKSARLIILADNDYYSHSESNLTSATPSRFAKFPVPLSGAHKTGLGSSAALVTSMTASVLSHYLPASLFDATSAAGRRTLHNLAQAAHCAAQGKVGSGFDVAAAVYGSSRYRRFSPSVLTGLPEPGAPGFGAALVALVDGASWDVEVDKQAVGVPPGLSLRMCDVDCGSQTVSMVKKVLAWKDGGGGRPAQLWDDLQARNEALGAALSAGDLDALPARVAAVRELVREMGQLSDVPIEPESQTKLLDAVSEVDGVFGGVVPGAGGFDAVALLLRDDAETERRVKDFLAAWSRDTGAKVKLLEVKGEMDGVRQESLDLYTGWIPGRSE